MELYRMGNGRQLVSNCRFLCHLRSQFEIDHQKQNVRSSLPPINSGEKYQSTAWISSRSQGRSKKHAWSALLSKRGSSCCDTTESQQYDTGSIWVRATSSQGISTSDIPHDLLNASRLEAAHERNSLEDSRAKAVSAASNSSSDLEKFFLKGARVTSLAQGEWHHFVREGDTVVDATCGNGNDSKWLAEKIGPKGQLVAFDIQEDAIRSTSAVLEDEVDPELLPTVRFVHGCHSKLEEHVQAARFVCFNLGFLPGGDRSIISQPATSVAAVKAAMNILEPGGIISVLAYVGHPGGMEEYRAVQEMATQVHPQEFTVLEQRILNRPNSPVLIMLWRRP